MPELEIIVLRSLTKDYALAGLRLGYAVASVATARLLQAQLPSWNVNSVAQAAGVAALADCAYLEETLNALFAERDEFFQALQESGLECVPSYTHFCLVNVKNAYDTRQCLMKRKILVRDCTSFGLPQYIRVSTRSKAEWQRLIIALQEGM
jgi:histidinol-phosphate/aromatic aminotransferase/cobyric acid decarboxylase-like protein